MSARTYTVFLDHVELKVTDEQLTEFAAACGLRPDIASRASELFWLDLYVYVKQFGIDVDDVLSEIRALETGEGVSQTKPALQFQRRPLKGLWHKHFFAAHFVAKNLTNALAGGRLEAIVNDVRAEHNSPVVTKDMLDDVSHRIVHGALESRSTDNKLTGEWIVFAKENQQNYYLCLNTHEAGDQQIFERVRDHCQREFPFLSAVLAQASA
jgi:hypothetical protein